MTLMEHLGYGPDARVVVVHVDDVGMCRAANRGFERACDSAATCGSIMVPCPAFEGMVKRARERDDRDLGVHLTLNCEYAGYRWGPVRDDVSSLVSPDGGMWRTLAETVEHAAPAEVARELRAQIERALECGIDVTHLDAHMGTALHVKFVDIYVALAREFELPMFLPRIAREHLAVFGLEHAHDHYVELIEGAAAWGFPMFDHFDTDSLHFAPGTASEHNRARLRHLGPGLGYLVTHCAEGDDELRSITGDWRQRAEECEIYADGTMRAIFAEEGIHTVGMRPLRDWLRQQRAHPA